MAERGKREPEGRAPRPALRAPRRSLGQHFLISARAAGAVAEALGPIERRFVLEIGPGRGILTEALLRRGARVLGIELDAALVQYLRARFTGAELEVVHADALAVDPATLARDRGVEPPVLVAGNIPYGITSPLLRRLLARPAELEGAVLMLQREVAERLLAEPGSGAYGALTVGVRAAADVRRVLTLSPARFRPQPRVWSSVVRLTPRRDAPDPERLARLERLAKTLFSSRRKQLGTALRRSGLLLPHRLPQVEVVVGVPLSARPEEISVEGFLRLLDLVEGT